MLLNLNGMIKSENIGTNFLADFLCFSDLFVTERLV
jgi:hypothetical protein